MSYVLVANHKSFVKGIDLDKLSDPGTSVC
jgi:hypothetical protein